MLSQHFVVQRIYDNSTVEVYQAHSDYLNWQFEDRRPANDRDNLNIFPFRLDSSINLNVSHSGAETSAFVRKGNYVVFNDRYGVPGGIVICILFPIGFAPDLMVFVERPTIPSFVPNNVPVSPPSYFDVYYNQHSKQSAIVFMISSPQYFEFRCMAKFVTGEFPKQHVSTSSRNAIRLSLLPNDLAQTHITSDDLIQFSHYFKPNVDLDDIQANLNRLIDLIHSGNNDPSNQDFKNVKKVLQGAIFATEFSSAIVQLLDSYSTGGSVAQVVTKLLAYIAMLRL